MRVDILGTKYTIEERNRQEDKKLEKCDGYSDKTVKLIVIDESEDTDLADIKVYKKKVLRHEILHAFLFESGLQENFYHPTYGHDETYLDWFACQFPKILEVYRKAGCI